MSSIKETIQAGKFLEVSEPGDFFRLLATTGPVDIEFYYQGRETVDVVGVEAGYAEYFRGGAVGEFDRVRVYSATTQQVQFVTRYGSDVRYDRGASSVTGTIALDAATLAALELISIRPEASTGYSAAVGALAANTAVQLVAPAANVNGIILLSASFHEPNNSTAWSVSLLARAGAAPATVVDGEPIFDAGITFAQAGANGGFCDLKGPQYVAPGLGLYWIASLVTSATSRRTARWKLL